MGKNGEMTSMGSLTCPISPRGSLVTNYASHRDRLYCCRVGSHEHWNERNKPEGEVIGKFENNEIAFVEGRVDEWLKIADRGWVKKEDSGVGWYELEVERHKILPSTQTCRGIQLVDMKSQSLLAIEPSKDDSLLLKLETCTYTVAEVHYDNKRTFTFSPYLRVVVGWEFLMQFVIALKKLCNSLDDVHYLETPANTECKGGIHLGLLYCDRVDIHMLSSSEGMTAEGGNHSNDGNQIVTPEVCPVQVADIQKEDSDCNSGSGLIEGSSSNASLEGGTRTTVVMLQNPPMIKKKQKPINNSPIPTNDEVVIDVRFRRRLMNFYQFYRPEKLPSVMPTVVGNFGNPDDIIKALVNKYGPEPRDIMSDPLRPDWQQIESVDGDMFYVHKNGTKQWVRPTEYLNDSAVNPNASLRK